MPASAAKKKVTGRYQLQFPLDWVRQRLQGRPAEAWRHCILEAFSAASPSMQQIWRAEFEKTKSKLMSSTLTVENRSGRRFDRHVYQTEAQLIYGVSLVPHGASPKLLARCFKHSVDFIVTRGLVREPAESAEHTLEVSTPSPLDDAERSRQPSLSREVTDSSAHALRRSVSVTRSLAEQDEDQVHADDQALSSALFIDDALDSLDDLGDFFEDAFGLPEDRGVLLHSQDSFGVELLPEVPDSVAAGLARRLPQGVCRRSVSVESQAVSGASTVGSQAMQVETGMGCAQAELEALRLQLAATHRDLAEARAQRDAAVRQAQAAGAFCAACAAGHQLQFELA